ncbi:hydroxyacid dehydrogenase [Lactobacillus sp. DCY120]|uniref:Hydroxyacid dehydrogenase n=1 Tax=Bombilactobacillus apium TaxID=2675299 RepID=A0A850QXR2_9LACO|nr:NAD(P)-dependent oxidoreductase [Bombilactobacillus apium]NVY96614.1 hydroxyacid dehydrogenase [Bombilactobacillus apium]
MPKVFITAQVPDNLLQSLQDAGAKVRVYPQEGAISQAELLAQIQDAEVLIPSLSTKIDREIMDQDPNLKMIANYGAGFDNLDLVAAKEKGIKITNTPGVSTNAVAELTLGLMLALSRRVVESDHLMHGQGFEAWLPLFLLGHELKGKTLGIVGLGSIGQAVAKLAQAFEMQVNYYKPTPLAPAKETELAVHYQPLDQLLAQSDFVSLNAALTESSRHLINAAKLKLMKPEAVLINVARGPVVDEAAVLEALKNKQIAGAALDVYEHEPQVAAGFKELDNVILTPHIGNATVEAREAMAASIADSVSDYLNGQTIRHLIN